MVWIGGHSRTVRHSAFLCGERAYAVLINERENAFRKKTGTQLFYPAILQDRAVILFGDGLLPLAEWTWPALLAG